MPFGARALSYGNDAVVEGAIELAGAILDRIWKAVTEVRD